VYYDVKILTKWLETPWPEADEWRNRTVGTISVIPEGASCEHRPLSTSGRFDEPQGTRTMNNLGIGNDIDIASDTDVDPDRILAKAWTNRRHMPSAQTYHQVHLALLGLIILFSLLGWTISAGFVNKNCESSLVQDSHPTFSTIVVREVSNHKAEPVCIADYIHRTAEGLEVAANLLIFLAGLALWVPITLEPGQNPKAAPQILW
jgi:hypothetical protein